MVGPGRGSAAGSIVSYLLGITQLDPIHYKLVFERFLNIERISMPDIDMDFTDTRRNEVIQYLEHKYGADHVAQIVTFGTMAARVSVRDVGRVLDVPYSFCDALAKMIPAFSTLEEALRDNPSSKPCTTPMRRPKIIDTSKTRGCRTPCLHPCLWYCGGARATPQPHSAAIRFYLRQDDYFSIRNARRRSLGITENRFAGPEKPYIARKCKGHDCTHAAYQHRS